MKDEKYLVVEERDLDAALKAAEDNKAALQEFQRARAAKLPTHELYQTVKDHCGICLIAQAAKRLFGSPVVGVTYTTIREGDGKSGIYNCWYGEFSELVVAYDNGHIDAVRKALPVAVKLNFEGTSGSFVEPQQPGK